MRDMWRSSCGRPAALGGLGIKKPFMSTTSSPAAVLFIARRTHWPTAMPAVVLTFSTVSPRAAGSTTVASQVRSRAIGSDPHQCITPVPWL